LVKEVKSEKGGAENREYGVHMKTGGQKRHLKATFMLRLLAKQAVKVARGQAASTCYGNMDLMFANMVSSGLCVPIHQPQTHLCNLGGNLSEERWAAESPPHCLAGPDEISKHTAVQASAPASQQQTQVAGVCEGVRLRNKLQDT